VITDPDRTRLAVLGSPIAHSRSPLLHAAAYAALGLPWSYERHEVGEGGLASFLDGLDDSWRGLSLTMPLKPEAFGLVDTASDVAEETGAVNTLLLVGGRRAGYNTDVHGIMQALRDARIEPGRSTLVLGAGATARSVVSAVRRLGAEEVTIAGRRPAPAEAVADYARRLGLDAGTTGLDRLAALDADLVVNTIPGGAGAGIAFGERLPHAPLLEIAYDPWPSPLVERWSGPVASGLEMLLHQAVAQVRVFATGEPDAPLPDEAAVVAAMRAAIAGAG